MLALLVFFLILLHLFELQRFVLQALEILLFGLFFPEVLNKDVIITGNKLVCRKKWAPAGLGCPDTGSAPGEGLSCQCPPDRNALPLYR